jgi:predicted AlkP superfamily pyrophosphatase or phosphodiesterase
MKSQFVRRVGLCAVFVIALALQSSYAGRALDLLGMRGVVERSAPTRAAALTRHVVLISIDGLRPESIERFGASTIRQVMRKASYTLRAQTVQPTKTLPAHASMLSGVEPRIHGMTWNRNTDSTLAVPTVFDLATQAGLTSAAFFSKSKLAQLAGPGDVDHVEVRSRWSLIEWDADHTVDAVIEYLEDGNRPNLLFVHIAEPDQTGHDDGWMSPEYGEAVQQADRALAELLAATDSAFGNGQYTVILTADHGGVNHGHDNTDPRSTRIPWITWGRGVACGKRLNQAVRTTDTAATIAWLLALDTPRQWSGRPVKGAFTRQAARHC